MSTARQNKIGKAEILGCVSGGFCSSSGAKQEAPLTQLFLGFASADESQSGCLNSVPGADISFSLEVIFLF